MTTSPSTPRPAFVEELAKLVAFARRDFRTTLSYQYPFVGDVFGLVFQTLMFYFVAKLVAPNRMPLIGGRHPDYLAFVSVGIAVAAFMQVGLGRMLQSVQNERMLGTLESLLVTPTNLTTIQLGPAFYDVIYVPIRTGLFLAIVSLIYGVHLRPAGFIPAAILLLTFMPFVWGLGLLGGAYLLTFRRGNSIIGLVATLLSVGSGAYFPLQLLPSWAKGLAEVNPMSIALFGLRSTLLGVGGWDVVWWRAAVLVPTSAITVVLGALAFRRAAHRERRLGTIGLY